MATFTTTTDRFPAGTTVTVYPESNWPQAGRPPSGAPIGSSTTSAVVSTASVLTFTGLAAATRYYMTASVGGTYRYVAFQTPATSGRVLTENGYSDQSALVIPRYSRKNGQTGMYAPSGTGYGVTTQAVAANTARLSRFVPDEDMTVTKIGFAVTAVSIGNVADVEVDVAIYSSSLARLVSSGATAGKVLTTGQKSVDITSTTLTAGTVYYIALSVGSIGTTTASLAAASYGGAGGPRMFGTANGIWEVDSATTSHPLPNPITVAGSSTTGWLLAVRES